MEAAVTKGKWSQVEIPLTAVQQFCVQDQHVKSGKCVPCPSGSNRKAGDDSLAGDTGCSCVKDRHVKSGKCAPCPSGSHKEAGDNTLDGDTGCTIVSVYSFDVGTTASVAANVMIWINGGFDWNPTRVRDMQSAACKSTLIVAWTAQFRRPPEKDSRYAPEGATIGYLSSFSATPEDVKLKLSVQLPYCLEMGEVVASSDCDLIAVLCLSRHPPSVWGKSFKQDLVEEARVTGHSIWGRKTEPKKDGTTEILSIYLLEWYGGAISDAPSAVFLINNAINTWRYGNYAIAMNPEGTYYSINVPITVWGGDLQYHAADMHQTFYRPLPASGKFLRYDWQLTDDYACGTGHTHWNVLTYNDALDKWGRWCWTDLDKNTVWFRVAGERGKRSKLMTLGDYVAVNNKEITSRQGGGPSDIVSFGSKGWLGALTGPGPLGHVDWPSQTTRTGIVLLPPSHALYNDEDYPVHWLQTASNGKSYGYAKLQHVGGTSVGEDADRFLFGYAELSDKKEPWKIRKPQRFVVQEINHKGEVLGDAKHVIHNSGWSERTKWTWMPESGCVVWAHAWGDESGPLGAYGSRDKAPANGLYTNILRINSYCPRSDSEKGPLGPRGCPSSICTPAVVKSKSTPVIMNKQKTSAGNGTCRAGSSFFT